MPEPTVRLQCRIPSDAAQRLDEAAQRLGLKTGQLLTVIARSMSDEDVARWIVGALGAGSAAVEYPPSNLKAGTPIGAKRSQLEPSGVKRSQVESTDSESGSNAARNGACAIDAPEGLHSASAPSSDSSSENPESYGSNPRETRTKHRHPNGSTSSHTTDAGVQRRAPAPLVGPGELSPQERINELLNRGLDRATRTKIEDLERTMQRRGLSGAQLRWVDELLEATKVTVLRTPPTRDPLTLEGEELRAWAETTARRQAGGHPRPHVRIRSLDRYDWGFSLRGTDAERELRAAMARVRAELEAAEAEGRDCEGFE